MAKTMRRIIIVGLLLVALAGALVACVVMSSNGSASNVRNTAMNAIVDQSGVKDRIDSELRSHVSEVSAATGIPESVIASGVDALAIKDWQVTDTPSNATETGSYSANVEGVDVGVTTYDDPSVVTVDAYGQEVTFALPDSATQIATEYLPYVQYLL